MTDTIDYGKLMSDAMRQMMANILELVSTNGLPGDHHFFITLKTTHPGVDIPSWLKDKYPDEMTIVIQEWFDELVVLSDRFSIILNFGDQPEHLTIPFDAVTTFVDPSVEMGLKFDPHEPNETIEENISQLEVDQNTSDQSSSTEGASKDTISEVVQLDNFRK